MPLPLTKARYLRSVSRVSRIPQRKAEYVESSRGVPAGPSAIVTHPSSKFMNRRRRKRRPWMTPTPPSVRRSVTHPES